MNQYFNAEIFATILKDNVDTFSSLAGSAFKRAERLVALNLDTSRAILEDSIASTRALLAAKTPQELSDAQATLLQPAIESGVALARTAYELALEAQQEAAALAESQIAELNKVLASSLEQAAKSAPAGSEGVFAAIKSVVAANNSAYDSLNKAAKQAADLAQANVSAASAAATKVVSLIKKAA